MSAVIASAGVVIEDFDVAHDGHSVTQPSNTFNSEMSHRDNGQPCHKQSLQTTKHGGDRRRKAGISNGQLKIMPWRKEKALWLKLLADAQKAQKLNIVLQVLEKIHEIQHGRPYVQAPPDSRGIGRDPMLAQAVANLLPGATIAQRETIAVLPKQMNSYAGESKENGPECIDALEVADSKGNV